MSPLIIHRSPRPLQTSYCLKFSCSVGRFRTSPKIFICRNKDESRRLFSFDVGRLPFDVFKSFDRSNGNVIHSATTSPIYDLRLDQETLGITEKTHTPLFFFSFWDDINISLKTNRFALLMKQSNKGFHVRSKSPRGNPLLLFTHLLPVKPVSVQISLYGL